MEKNKCDKIVESIIEQINNKDLNSISINTLYNKHPECKEKIKSSTEIWMLFGELEKPQPSASMDDRFYASLDALSEKPNTKIIQKTNFFQRHKTFISGLAVAATLFIAGMLVGPFLQDEKPTTIERNNSDEYYHLAADTEKQLSYDRLENVNKIKELPQLNQKIIDALNQALLKDPNINVRLSAIEAMIHFADNPQVRQNLIEAIPFQTSPIVQLTLAEVMIELQETRSRDAWKTLLEKNGMEEDVKKQLEETLDIII